MSRRNEDAWVWWRKSKARHWPVPAHFSRHRLRYRHRQQRQLVAVALARNDYDSIPGKRPKCLKRDYW